MYKLGNTLDFGPGVVPVDFHTATNTGIRANLRNAQSVIFKVSMAAAASGTDDLVFTLNEHTAKTGGTTTALANITTWWLKSATTLDGTQTWTKQTQAAGSTFTIPGASYATKQVIAALQVNTKDLDDTYDYVSLSCAATAAISRLGVIDTILTDLTVRRDPANLAATLF
ncbi:MAG TPA: hypothetical protein VFQ42_04055 [Mycobacterium sp.]|nr:hypothetical protein [Mycobacterium sp.]